MARKWSDFFRDLHAVLSRKRWQRLGLTMFLACAIALTGPLLMQFPVQAQVDPVALVEQGQQQFEDGQYSDAVTSLEAAIAAFDPQTQSLQRAITFSNLALVHQASGDWGAAEAALQTCFSLLEVPPDEIVTNTLPTLSTEQLHIFASALNVYGKGLLQKGNPDRALEVWRQTERAYTAVGDREGQIASQTNQLQALQSLGRFQQADTLADTIKESISTQPDSPLKAKGLLNLGNIKRAIGQLSASQTTLEEALAITQNLDQPELMSALQLSLGTTYHALGNRDKERLVSINRQGIPPWVCSLPNLPDTLSLENYQTALDYYEVAAEYAPNQVATDLNTLAVLQARNQLDTTAALQTWRRVEQQLPTMRPSRTQVYAHIALAKQGACLNLSRQPGQDTGAVPMTKDAISPQTIQTLLERAIAIAQDLEDAVAASYTLGNLGGWYEALTTLYPQAADNALSAKSFNANLTWHQTARELTEQALFLAQPSALPDIAFQWQWQLGRLAEAEGKEDDAIAHYKQAAKTLDSVRGNLLTIDSDVQFSFRDNVEPLYRELVDLLLRQPEETDPEVLKDAIQFIDTLQLAELENFLQCSLAAAQLDEEVVDRTAATLYGIVLKDRIEIILSLPDESLAAQKLENHEYRIAQEEFDDVLTTLQKELKSPRGTNAVQALTSKIYDGIIRPFETALDTETDIDESNLTTLAFVLDGSLRSLPMGVLYDAERDRYLLQRYATVLVPSRNLLEPEPLSRNINLFAGGVSQSVKHPLREGDFSGLENVQEEIEALQNIFPADVLLDGDLTEAELTKKVTQQTFPVVHLATHGEFSSDPERTFIMLSDGPLLARKLDKLLRTRNDSEGSVKMLVLSACNTASGDKRATLGLAGLTVRSGSRSTLATLWAVQDESAPALMQNFYQNLKDNPGITKAEALRRAQIQLWENSNWQRPLHWAPYILVGNWL
ncbi:MAG: CHAT domain-containing protein [Cyanobacteria bacterium J06626_18]